MKSLSVFLCLLAVGALMTACEKEAINTLSEKGMSDELKTDIQAKLDVYEKEQVELTIEHLTLEELNQVYIDNGLEPITLEQIGMTHAEYEAAQASINNPDLAQSRCSGSNVLAVILGDMNNSTTLTAFDNVLATQYFQSVGRNITTSTPLPYKYFALFSHFHANVEADFLDEYDTYLSAQAILGNISCYNLQ